MRIGNCFMLLEMNFRRSSFDSPSRSNAANISRLSCDSLIPSTALIQAKPYSPRVKPLVCGRGAARFVFIGAE